MTLACASRLSSMTMRMPSRSDSSRMSRMPVDLAARARDRRSFSIRFDLFTMNGISVMMMLSAPFCVRLDVRARAHDDAAAAGQVGVADAGPPEDDAAGREVGALDDLEELLVRDVRIVDDRDDALDDLPEVVRRDVRRHADGDAGGAVHEEVRELRGKDRRLLARLVVVRARSRRSPSRGPRAGPPRSASAAPRCTARPPRCRRRSSRSCPARPRAGSAARSPAPSGPSRRRRPLVPCGW